MLCLDIWATSWQNQQTLWPSEDSDQPGHPPSLISLRSSLLSAWRNLGSLRLSFQWAQSEDSDQTGCTSFCWFYHAAAHIVWLHAYCSNFRVIIATCGRVSECFEILRYIPVHHYSHYSMPHPCPLPQYTLITPTMVKRTINSTILRTYCRQSLIVTDPKIIISDSLDSQYMSLVTRKPVFRVFDQVRLKPVCSAAEAS